VTTSLRQRRLALFPSIVTVALALAAIASGPLAQPAGFHDFADGSRLLGVPHAGDVLSNAGFLFVGLWGLQRMSARGDWRLRRPGRSGRLLFLISIVLTSVGSAFYHLSPDNARLVWDRLPIALACAGLLAASRAEMNRHENVLITAGLAALAIASVIWWRVTDVSGLGDLRPYLLMQVLPLIVIPLWQWIDRAPPAERIAYGVAIALYVVAKICELNDRELHAVLAPISGHTLKHVLATAACSVLVASRSLAAERQPDCGAVAKVYGSAHVDLAARR
jgi:hypothetical protein